MKKNLIIGLGVILVLAVLIPFLLDWILEDVTKKDWLSFYGSYIGGTITACISFFILFFTISNNKKELEVTRQEDNFRRLQDDLKNRVAQLDFTRIGDVVLVINDLDRCKEEILRLSNYSQELTYSFNSFCMIYKDVKDDKISNFKGSYILCIKELQDYISRMKILIGNLPPYISQEKITLLKQLLQEHELNNPPSSFYSSMNTPNSVKIQMEEYREQIKSVNLRDVIIKDMNSLLENLKNKPDSFIKPVTVSALIWLENEEGKLAKLKE